MRLANSFPVTLGYLQATYLNFPACRRDKYGDSEKSSLITPLINRHGYKYERKDLITFKHILTTFNVNIQGVLLTSITVKTAGLTVYSHERASIGEKKRKYPEL